MLGRINGWRGGGNPEKMILTTDQTMFDRELDGPCTGLETELDKADKTISIRIRSGE